MEIVIVNQKKHQSSSPTVMAGINPKKAKMDARLKMSGMTDFFSSSPPVGSEYSSSFCHTRMYVAGIHLFAVIPAVSGGYPSERNPGWMPD